MLRETLPIYSSVRSNSQRNGHENSFTDYDGVTCLDSRCSPYEVLGLSPREVLCTRNVSGRVKPALSDIAALDTIFGLHQVIVMHHSNCGSTHSTPDQQRKDLKARGLSSDEVEDVVRDSAIRSDDDGSLQDDLKLLRDTKYIRSELAESAVGLWLDVDTGLVREVKATNGTEKV